MKHTTSVIRVGELTIRPEITKGLLHSLGSIEAGGARLRNPATRFLPWFDTYAGDVFRQFEFLGVQRRGAATVLRTRAVSDPDVLFRERRDVSGDLCFRNSSWDDKPVAVELRIVFAPVRHEIDGREFTGFKYWFEYDSNTVAIHRLVDRQTWEVGGNLDDVTLCLRNWITPPQMRVKRETEYSTVGLDKWSGLLPGNMWGRWSLLPAFDMQFGKAGVLLGWFDQVSLIRTVVESNPGEDSIRMLDMHLFKQSKHVRTNPKTVVWSPDRLDDVDALNLWTRVHDQEHAKACRQFDIREGAPPLVFPHNVWQGVRFDKTYEHVVNVAAEFGGDFVFIDAVWEHQQAFKERLNQLIPPAKRRDPVLQKFNHQNMCVTLDFEVAQVLGGEKALKALCDRARRKGVGILSWMATHYSPNSALPMNKRLNHGQFGIFAARESGRHPDTGYPSSCWTANLNGPIYDRLRRQLLGVCKRTGLKGFLWDSYCNLGWWQVDYSTGDMRPQFDKMAGLYGELTRAGLCLLPEAIVAFSNNSCCGLHAGDVYAGNRLGYSYNTTISLNEQVDKILTGKAPIDWLFQALAHKRVPHFGFHRIPRSDWDPANVTAIKGLFAMYKTQRERMVTRTVLRDGCGVLWENGTKRCLLFSFRKQAYPGKALDVASGCWVKKGKLLANRVYELGSLPKQGARLATLNRRS